MDLPHGNDLSNTPPANITSGTRGYYQVGNPDPAALAYPSVFTAYAAHSLTMEILNVIQGAGLTPDPGDLGQMWKGMSSTFATQTALTALQAVVTALGARETSDVSSLNAALAAQASKEASDIASVRPGRMLRASKLTSSQTFALLSGTTTFRVRAVAGGGAGGGCPSTSSTQQATAAGGASGTYAEAIFAVADIGTSSFAVVIGAGAAATAAGANSGATGGTTSVGSFLSLPGGSGGSGGTASAGNATVFGASNDTTLPTASNGSLLVALAGLRNGQPQLALGTYSGSVRGGDGGSSPFGTGGGGGTGSAGSGGTGFGSGGGGCSQSASQAGDKGGSGAGGCVIIEEFS